MCYVLADSNANKGRKVLFFIINQTIQIPTMLKKLFTTITISLGLLVTSAQSKECRISVGTGIAGTTRNAAKTGQNVWLQLDYGLLNNISLAFDFENMAYTHPGYYVVVPFGENEIKVIDNNFSLLIKYNLDTKKKIKLSFGSGWSYGLIQEDYFHVELFGSGSSSYRQNTTLTAAYRIPFLLEGYYAVFKNIGINVRAKYNLHPQSGNTYSAGLGLSLKL